MSSATINRLLPPICRMVEMVGVARHAPAVPVDVVFRCERSRAGITPRVWPRADCVYMNGLMEAWCVRPGHQIVLTRSRD